MRHPNQDEIENELSGLARELTGGWGWDAQPYDIVPIPFVKLTLEEARALRKRLSEKTQFEDATEELQHNLKLAERYLSRAMDVCYRLEHPAKRNFWFRRALGNAQNIVMTILVRDIKKNR